MVDFGSHFQHFQFDIGAHRSKDMIALGSHRFGGRLRQGRILLERFVIGKMLATDTVGQYCKLHKDGRISNVI